MKKILYVVISFILLQACSTSKRPHYKSINENWAQRQLPNAQPTLSPALQLVQELVNNQPNSSVVFLGNQVTDGIPEEDDPALAIAQQSLREQFLPFKNYQGNVMFKNRSCLLSNY